MRKIKYIILMTLCVLGITACQDDLIDNPSTGGIDINKPVKVDLKFGIPKSMEVEVSRADNSYSGMYNARLYVFSGNTFLRSQDVSISDGTLVKGTDAGTSDSGQSYTANKVTLYVGSQTVYAVGNTLTGYWQTGTMTAVDAAATQGLDAFKQALYNLSSSTIDDKGYPSFSTQYMPLSGSGEVTVQENENASGTIRLKRLVSQIKFEITTLYQAQDKKVTFEPSNYTFHNIATQGYVIDDEGNAVLSDAEYYDANPVNIAGAGDDNVADFSVFIPENIQTAKQTGAQDYDARESFTGQGSDKDWSYAPDNGTYVVISGVCTEEDESGNLQRYGNVEYIIHLGDFSDTGSMDDYSVERNCIYTYKVSVQGMDKIKVEAEKDSDEDYQNGAEGNVIELGTGAKIFNLDAHFEQVFVEYNLSDILAKVKELHPESAGTPTDDEIKADIANQFQLVIHTPMNTEDDKVVFPYNSTGDEATDMAGIDYKWIEFYPQEQANAIALYPGQTSDKLYSPYEVCQMMGEAVFQLYKAENSTPSVEGLVVEQGQNGSYVARFTIFLDEYFYTKDLKGKNVAWDRFTRQDPRTMLIASDMKISDDLNSTYSTAQTYITQRAIQTFYNPDAANYYNALGIETFNETGVIADFSAQHNEGTSSNPHYVSENMPISSDQSKGRDNMLKNMGILPNTETATDENWTTKQWNTYINFANVGYTDDNSNSNNRWNTIWNAQTAYAYYACMSRNRDLDGDGDIDPTEVRWYLPALSQYLRMGIGKNALPAETRLFTGDASTMTGRYPQDYYDQGVLYYTNTSIPENTDLAFSVYWAVEVGAYGAQANYDAMVRCVRNLPNQRIVDSATGDDDVKLVNRDAWAGPVYDEVKTINDGDNYLFDFGDRLVSEIFRNSETPQRGPYLPHNETDVDEMKLPQAFVVAENNIYVRSNNPDIPLGTYNGRANYNNNGVEHGATFRWTYSEGGDDPCSSYYEDRDVSQIGYWRTPSLNELMVMSTVSGLLLEDENTYSRTQFTLPGRDGFYYNTGGFITTSNIGSVPGYIRCVRDAAADEIPVN